MSLATRCTSCGTVFRVVQDQLKVSEGWVRCGRCNEVFNALQGLFDLERDTPPEWSPAHEHVVAGLEHPASRSTAGESRGTGDVDAAADPSLVHRIDAEIFGPLLTDSQSDTPGSGAAVDTAPSADGQVADEVPKGEEPRRADVDAASETALPFPAPEDDFAPDFIRHADRRARWHHPGVRIALRSAALGLSLLLALQVAHHFRDLGAARWPETKPLLERWCAWTGCRIDTPRRLEDISVESSALTHADTPEVLGLSVTLRNRSAMALAWPAIDLTLTDSSGALVARRALQARDFLVSSDVVPPGTEVALRTRLSVAGGRVSGYTIELFYP